MQIRWENFRNLLAVTLSSLAGFLGIYGMLTGETLTNAAGPNGSVTSFDTLLSGMTTFTGSMGLIFLLCGIALVLVGYNDRKKTEPDHITDLDED